MDEKDWRQRALSGVAVMREPSFCKFQRVDSWPSSFGRRASPMVNTE
jgi:hypothetical protein